MPEANANDEGRHERRLVDRRLDQVEREVQGLTSGFTKLGAALEAVKVEQGNVKEVLKSRFDALFKGQELLEAKLDAFTGSIHTMAGDASLSPAGRQIIRELDEVQERQKRNIARIDEVFELRPKLLELEKRQLLNIDRIALLYDARQQLIGAARLGQFIGLTGLLMAIAAMLKAFGLFGGAVP